MLFTQEALITYLKSASINRKTVERKISSIIIS